jgi:PAS domain-containing protein
VLQADRTLAPGPGDAFLVTDDKLMICAASEAAERLFGQPEPALIHRPLSHFLRGVEVDSDGAPRLPQLMRSATDEGLRYAETIVLLTGQTESQRVRVGACGPPSAALLMIERP